MSRAKELAHIVDERRGDLEPAIVNIKEKTGVRKLADAVDKRRLQEKIKTDEPIGADETSWGGAISNATKKFSVTKFMSEPIKALYQIPNAIYEVVKNHKIVGKELKEFGLSTARTAVGRSLGYSDEQIGEVLKETGATPTWINMEKSFYNKYGTEEGLKKHMQENPEEALLDLFTAFIPAGKVAELLGTTTKGVSTIGSTIKAVGKSKFVRAVGADLENLNKLGIVLERTGKVVKKVGAMGDPLNITQQMIKQPISFAMQIKALKHMPQNIYAKAIKLSDKIPKDKQEQLLRVALDNDAKIVYRDINRVEKQITDLNEVISDAIRQSDQTKTIDLKGLKKGLDDLRNDKYSKSLDADSISAIDEVEETIDKFNSAIGRSALTPVEAQKLKVGLNRELAMAYKRIEAGILSTPATAEAKMIVNRNLREHLQIIIPEMEILKFDKINQKILKRYFPKADNLSLKDVNMIEGNLIEIKHAMEMEANKTTKGSFFDFKVGQKTATFAFAGGAGTRALTSDPATISAVMAATGGAGFVIGVLDSSSYLKSKLAVYLRNIQRLGLNVKPSGALIRMGLYNASKDEREEK